MNIYPLFPVAVGKFELGRDYTTEEINFVNSQKKSKNQGNTTSEDNYVLRHDAMASLKEFVETSVGEYLQSIYAPRNKVGLRITQSWLNYCKPDEWHHKHNHSNSFLSGVLYVKATKEHDRIYFYNDIYRQLNLPTDNYNLYNSDNWWLEVGTGELFLFPSSLTHMVEPVKEERISLSFNTFPIGYAGEYKNLTALHLSEVG